MAFLSEDDIEQAALKVLTRQLGYTHLNCLHTDAFQRSSRKDVFDHARLLAALQRLNPALSASVLHQAAATLTANRSTLSLYEANREFYQLLTRGIEVKTTTAQGRDELRTVRVLDFNHPDQNEFVVVSQLWIESETGAERRPDLLLYINGLPLIFIELKRSDKPLQNAYDDNLVRYRDLIRQLFVPNVACVLSNGAEAKVGAYNAKFRFFKDWLRVVEDKDNAAPLSKKTIQANDKSLEHLLLSFCPKATLLDYIENFVLYKTEFELKIVAQNHQFLGVNNALRAYEARKDHPTENGLGTFWHTQGSGKSLSIVFFTEKLRRKYVGDFTFLIVTDRDDLDTQIFKEYVRSGVISDAKGAPKARPAGSSQLRDWLSKDNRRYIFTLIHKFRPEQKGKRYPLLSDRRDIIVIVDEAHRTQYADLAENMRIGLPNARFLAFTGTPLIQSGITERFFGEVVSEYNFAQSIEDEATVPLFYNRRVPQVQIANDDLQADYEEIVSGEDLTAEQIEKLENKFIREYEVLKRDDRLEIIAKDIVKHFPNRGYLGKGMVVTIDKFTAVRLYDKVKYHWNETIKNEQRAALKAPSRSIKDELQQKIKWMQQTEMAVVISAEDGEEEKFANKDLLIKPHRERMGELDDNGHDIEDNFKDDEHPLRLVFVCAMWLTGFDAPTVSTLYMDKPMQNHTLMQTIARANRITAYLINGISKLNGEIIDYYGVFKNLKKALAVYAQGSQTNGVQVEKIVESKDVLKNLLKAVLEQCVTYCRETVEFDPLQLVAETDKLRRTALLEDFGDMILAKDDYKKKFVVLQNTISDFYAACQPEILQDAEVKTEADIFKALRGVIDRKKNDDDRLANAAQKVSSLLDVSVLAEPESNYSIDEKKTFTVDLSRLNYEKLRQEFQQTKHKNIAVADIRAFIEAKLQQMIAQNPSRATFRERYEALLQGYNDNRLSVDVLVDEFTAFMQTLEEEQQRHLREGLTLEELVVFDLLEKPKLTPTEKEKVKTTARTLLTRLKEEKDNLLVPDWHRDNITKLQVEMVINQILNDYLPDSYDKPIFEEKKRIVLSNLIDGQAMKYS